MADLLETIDRCAETGARRAELRFLSLVHDAMRYRVRDWLPKAGENHHAMRARRFAERYTDDERVLATIELHDRPYALWRRRGSGGPGDESALDRMLDRIPDLDLFVRFIDSTGQRTARGPNPSIGCSAS